jgi:transcriptional regulator with XRE-family HTH domain
MTIWHALRQNTSPPDAGGDADTVDNPPAVWSRLPRRAIIRRVTDRSRLDDSTGTRTSDGQARLPGKIGVLLRGRRQRRRLRQEDLAVLAGVSQAAVARVERGERAGLQIVERLFAALDLQLRVEVEPLDAHLDAELQKLADQPLQRRIQELMLVELIGSLDGVPFLFDGTTAALLQGVPLPGHLVQLAVAWSDVDAFVGWLDREWAQRWHEKWEEYAYLLVDPREPGAHRWRTKRGEITARMVDELPSSIDVLHDGVVYPVMPLCDVEMAEPKVAELLTRHRTRRGAAQP